jgi:hypothetical protein
MECDRQERERKQQDDHMRQNLLPYVIQTRQQVRVDVSQQKHRLKKKNTGRPNCGGASKKGQHDFPNHGLAEEKQECADE